MMVIMYSDVSIHLQLVLYTLSCYELLHGLILSSHISTGADPCTHLPMLGICSAPHEVALRGACSTVVWTAGSSNA